MASAQGVPQGPVSIETAVDAPPDAEVIFLPSNPVGTPGPLNTAILERLGLPVNLPSRKELARGYALSSSRTGLICYIVTVGEGLSEELLSRNFARALDDTAIASASSYWVPLMGTGAGGLRYEDSFRILYDQLSRYDPILNGRARAVISFPPGISGDEHQRIAAAALEVRGESFPPISPSPASSTHSATQPKLGAEKSAGAATSPYALPRTAAVTALLELASAFAFVPVPPRPVLSTSLLFFALAESQTPVIVEELFRDVAARYFAMTVEDVCGDNYEAAWENYFGSHNRPPGTRDSLMPPTENVTEALRAAHIKAGGGEHQIEVDHLITALLEREEARLHQLLQAMEIAPADLLQEYLDARLGRVATKFQNDVANSEDHLDYARYANAIHAFLTDKETRAPLSISVQAPWGGGKSTLMHLVREALDPEKARNQYKNLSLADLDKLPRLLLRNVTRLLGKRIEVLAGDGKASPRHRWTIWFNAWKYETTEQLWAGLVDAIVSQVAQRLTPFEREKFLLKLQLSRIDDGIIRKRIYDRIVNLWWRRVKVWLATACSALIALFGLSAAKPAMDPALQQAVSLWTGSGFVNAIAVQLILTFGFLASFLWSRFKTRREPANFSLADILRCPIMTRAWVSSIMCTPIFAGCSNWFRIGGTMVRPRHW